MKRVLLFLPALAALPVLIFTRAFDAKVDVPVRTLEIRIHHSRFVPGALDLERGQKYKFRVVNSDPIDHELIVGDESVQRRHEDGTEAVHGEVPGEVTVPAGQSAETTFEFRKAGTFLFGCHFPGHYAYGMRAPIRVK